MLLKNINGPAVYVVQTAVAKVSNAKYGGNLITPDARAMPSTKRGNACRFTLRVKDSYSKPARRAPSGRRINAANWQAHKEVMQEIFNLYPSAILVTALTTYTGKDDFERRNAETAQHMTGNAINASPFGSL